MFKKSVLIMCAFSLGACVSAPTNNELSKANYGELPSNYQELVKNHLTPKLKDPYSAQYNFSEPYKGWCKSGFTTYYGWLLPLSLNAKNSYGAYAGSSAMLFLIKDNNATDFTAPYQVGGCGKS